MMIRIKYFLGRIVFEMKTNDINKQKKTFILNLFSVVNITQQYSDY